MKLENEGSEWPKELSDLIARLAPGGEYICSDQDRRAYGGDLKNQHLDNLLKSPVAFYRYYDHQKHLTMLSQTETGVIKRTPVLAGDGVEDLDDSLIEEESTYIEGKEFRVYSTDQIFNFGHACNAFLNGNWIFITGILEHCMDDITRISDTLPVNIGGDTRTDLLHLSRDLEDCVQNSSISSERPVLCDCIGSP